MKTKTAKIKKILKQLKVPKKSSTPVEDENERVYQDKRKRWTEEANAKAKVRQAAEQKMLAQFDRIDANLNKINTMIDEFKKP